MPSRVITTNPLGALPDSSFRYTPLQHIRVSYIQFVQGLFHQAPLGQYHWEPDDSSEIVITDENPVRTEQLNVRPCITFTRAPVLFYSLGIDDMLAYDFRTGTKRKSLIIPGTMSINVCSRSDIESENLAFVVAEHIWLQREVLMQQGFYDIGRQIAIGAPSPPGSIIQGEGAEEWFATTITSPFHFFRTSQFTPLNARGTAGDAGVVNEIATTLNTEVTPVPDNSPPNGEMGIVAEPPETGPLPIQPSPNNPAQRVRFVPVRPNSTTLKAPSINGRLLISAPSVEQSNPHMATKLVVKI